MNKHTPGPWWFNKSDLDARTHGYAIMSRVPKGWEETICAVEQVDGEYPTETNERRLADARLIAAAPELLEVAEQALEQLKLIYKPTPLDGDAALIRKMEAAVLKAKGES